MGRPPPRDRITAIAGTSVTELMPRPQEIVKRSDRRDEELRLTVVGADGATRELRTTLREPPIGR